MTAKTLPYLLIYAALAFIISCSGSDGSDGVDGESGTTPQITIGANGNWYIDGVDTGVIAQGANGVNGQNGINGTTPTIGSNGNWYVNGLDTGVKAQGVNGEQGLNGINGTSCTVANSGDGTHYVMTCPGQAAVSWPKAMCGSTAYNPSGNQFCDGRDGQIYKWVKIGTQTWMAKNLNYKTGNSKCYGNDYMNCVTYGRLYDWETAMEACPYGWHLPSNAEWDKLVRHADGTNGTTSPYNSPTAGKYLKAASGWNNKTDGTSGNGTDAFGFSALPGGSGYSGGGFYNVGNYGFWWSSTEYGSSDAYFRYMDYHVETAGNGNYHKDFLQSVRCLQD